MEILLCLDLWYSLKPFLTNLPKICPLCISDQGKPPSRNREPNKSLPYSPLDLIGLFQKRNPSVTISLRF